MYYGVWVNPNEDTFSGTRVHDEVAEVIADLLHFGEPDESDNLIVFDTNGLAVRTYDLDADAFVECGDHE